ncbi:MAG: helix-turn-helix transcriptional regulator [Desulfocapsaceae bacterium]|nr:helix-turn-helix transcriptional regulator [Desulfocapsaceae bacterium]
MIHERTFKERLYILIGERGNKSFERRTGISENTLRQYLRGDSLPTLKTLEQIAKANGVSVGWLIGEELQPQVADSCKEKYPNESMQEIAQWIASQHDGINYWEILKAKLAQEYPDFKAWLKQSTKN